jgi:hypothetical protein
VSNPHGNNEQWDVKVNTSKGQASTNKGRRDRASTRANRSERVWASDQHGNNKRGAGEWVWDWAGRKIERKEKEKETVRDKDLVKHESMDPL